MAGVSVFVFGQFILKLVLDPIVSFKESLGSVSAFCLQHQAKITNGNANDDLQCEFRRLISTVISKKMAIPFYSLICCVFNLPSKDELLNGCQNLNYIAYEMCKETATETRSPDCTKITILLEETAQLLSIRLNYSVV